MSGYIHVTCLGRLGNDPEVKQTQGGLLASMSLATSESWTDKQSGEKKENTQWTRVVMFDKKAELAQKFLKKGNEVLVTGKLTTRKWKDDKGFEKSVTEVVADKLVFVGGNKSEDQSGQARAGAQVGSSQDDDVPF